MQALWERAAYWWALAYRRISKAQATRGSPGPSAVSLSLAGSSSHLRPWFQGIQGGLSVIFFNFFYLFVCFSFISHFPTSRPTLMLKCWKWCFWLCFYDFFIIFYLCAYVSVTTGSVHRGQLPWNWRHRRLWTAVHGDWEQNYGPLQDQQVLLTTKPLLFPPFLWVLRYVKHCVFHFLVLKLSDLFRIHVIK